MPRRAAGRQAMASGTIAWYWPDPSVHTEIGADAAILPCRICEGVLVATDGGKAIVHQVLVRHRASHKPDGHDVHCHCGPCCEVRSFMAGLQ